MQLSPFPRRNGKGRETILKVPKKAAKSSVKRSTVTRTTWFLLFTMRALLLVGKVGTRDGGVALVRMGSSNHRR